jgi:hypothetical protein
MYIHIDMHYAWPNLMLHKTIIQVHSKTRFMGWIMYNLCLVKRGQWMKLLHLISKILSSDPVPARRHNGLS